MNVEENSSPSEREDDPVAQPRGRRAWTVIAGGTGLVLLIGGALVWRADRGVNRIPLGGAPRPVSVIEAEAGSYRDSRSYVGTLEPWIEASVGPQFIAAYVETVLVRPGMSVTQGQILATLDCANEAAESRAVAMQARAINEQQRAQSDEAARVGTLLAGGFVAKNEAEQSAAKSASELAQLAETQARLSSSSLRVKDCVLRAPFAGEIGTRSIDPGAFVRPGTSIVSIVDRLTIRVSADAPEKDSELIAPSTAVQIDLLATGRTLAAKVSRRAPRADPNTRTIHFEMDVPDPERSVPVGTTGIVRLDVGAPVPALVVPSYAATVGSGKAKLFVVEDGKAHLRSVLILGESRGRLYLDPAGLPAHASVVTEGRALLSDGDAVNASRDQPDGQPDASGAPRGGGFGRPL